MIDRKIYKFLDMCSECKLTVCPVNKFNQLCFGLRLEESLKFTKNECKEIINLHESEFGKLKINSYNY